MTEVWLLDGDSWPTGQRAWGYKLPRDEQGQLFGPPSPRNVGVCVCIVDGFEMVQGQKYGKITGLCVCVYAHACRVCVMCVRLCHVRVRM